MDLLIRFLILASLTKEDGRSDIPLLIEGLGSDRFIVRHESEMELRKIGLSAVPFLLKEKNNPDLEIRRRVRWLLHQSDPCSIKPTKKNPTPWFTNRWFGGTPSIYCLSAPKTGRYCRENCHQPDYLFATIVYYYHARALRKLGLVHFSATDESEVLATKILICDLIEAGFSRESIVFLLDDMVMRENPYPPCMRNPPGWIFNHFGISVPKP